MFDFQRAAVDDAVEDERERCAMACEQMAQGIKDACRLVGMNDRNEAAIEALEAAAAMIRQG